MNPDVLPILLDTDIGSDIDDAVALAYLLAQPRCELVGITTVTGDVQKRAAIAEVMCRVAGKAEIPIHCGRREPLGYGAGQPEVPQYDAVAGESHRLDRPEDTAVDFLRQTIRERPGEITLLTIGPLSNVATLFAIDPGIPRLLKGIVSMAGMFSEAKREWNVVVDPEAAAIVYAADRPHHRSFGLDVTLQCRMAADEVERRFQGDLLGVVYRMAQRWFERSGEITFHDPLAAASIFREDLVGVRKGQVRVRLDADSEKSGLTHLQEGDGPDEVAETVDVPAFFDEFFAVVTPNG